MTKRAPELLPEYLMNQPEALAGQYVVFVDNSPMVVTPAFYSAERHESRLRREHPEANVEIRRW